MDGDVDCLLRDVLHLAPDERARIVAELLASLVPDLPSQQCSEAEWIQEIERGARAAAAGSPGLRWPESRTRVENRLPGD
jgi:Putative addiction module component